MTTTKSLAALSALFHTHRVALVKHIQRLVNCPATAEDIAQEAYLRLAQSSAQTDIEHPRAYLFRVARSISVDQYRHRQLEARYIDSDADIEDTGETHPSTEAVVSAQQRWTVMAEALNDLPPVCRNVFVMNKLHAIPHAEIARQLGISQSMVEKHMMRAMSHCRKRLVRRES